MIGQEVRAPCETLFFCQWLCAFYLSERLCLSREENIAISILRLLELEKAVVEGAGATGLAAIVEGLLPELQGKK